MILPADKHKQCITFWAQKVVIWNVPATTHYWGYFQVERVRVGSIDKQFQWVHVSSKVWQDASLDI